MLIINLLMGAEKIDDRWHWVTVNDYSSECIHPSALIFFKVKYLHNIYIEVLFVIFVYLLVIPNYQALWSILLYT